jgi:Integrase zinc binding domain
MYGQLVEMFVVSKTRRASVLHLAHDNSHQAMKNTRDRIGVSLFTWHTLFANCKQYATQCHKYQVRVRITCYDRVPITAVERAQEPFSH